MMIEISSKSQFVSEIAQGVVLVDFYAAWCGPCRMLAPVMEDLSHEFATQGVKIVKVNVDENPDLAAEYGIMSIPTVMFFNQGTAVETLLGLSPKTVYQEKLQALIASASS